MQSFLIIGEGVEELRKNLGAKILNFPIHKIEDIRELNRLLKLSFNEKTLIVCKNIQDASEETLNAFLKTLEEPQENIYFALTASNIAQVLPTIVSRCQVIKVGNKRDVTKSDFIEMNTIQKINFVEKIKDRSEAINFVEELMYYLYSQNTFDNLELILKTHTRLRASGNVNLQLLNLAISYK